MKHVVDTLAQGSPLVSRDGLSTSAGGKQAALIRQAAAEDVSALAAIAQRAYRASFIEILDEAALQRADTTLFAERFSPRLEQMILAELDRRPVGFALVEGETLAMLFVDAAGAGAGAGSALLRAAESQGARRLETFGANRAARRFYERRGWALSLLYRRPFLGRGYAFAAYVRGSTLSC